MAIDDQLKKEDYLEGDRPNIELTEVSGTVYAREADGTWRYADSWIKVPGARDLTLTERFRPKLVIANRASGQEVERVVVAGEDIGAHPDLLEWCLAEGAPVHGPEGEILEVLVPFELWQDRDRIPGEVVAPEHSGNPADRDLAEAERKVREAEQALEQATDMRAFLLREYAGEMTREQARAITGLSVGRIQQLIKGDADLDETDEMVMQAIRLSPDKRPNSIAECLKEVFGLSLSLPSLSRKLKRLEQLDLVIGSRKGRVANFLLTPSGAAALDAAAARREREN
jgi:DNA-binding transcriptional ArsR family regulator